MAGPRYANAELYVDADPAFHTFIRRTLEERRHELPAYDRVEVDVVKHKAYERDADPTSLWGWRTIIWVTAAGEASDGDMIAFVRDLIRVLAEVGYRSRAVCPFSDEVQP